MKIATQRLARLVQALLLLPMVSLAAMNMQDDTSTATGRVVFVSHDFGEAWVYRPRSAAEEPANAVLVIVHGAPDDDEKASETARTFIDRWTAFSEEENLLLIAPAFDRPRYQAAYGGYRGLFGRDIGADVFVERLVRAERANFEVAEQKIVLYGHSAGAQFVCRFLMQHPDRVLAAVLSAPGRYTFPDPNAAWPYGIGPFEKTLHWGGDGPNARKREVVRPRRQAIVEAAARPVAVVVGSDDLEPQPPRPAHHGANRVELAKQWVRDMKALAQSQDRHSRVHLKIVPNISHSSRQLTPHCQNTMRALFGES